MTVSPDVVNALHFQSETAVSPLYQLLLDATVRDIDVAGPCADVLSHTDPSLNPIADAVPLRFLGGVHRLVLTGAAPELAAHYPSVGGRFDASAPDPAIANTFVATVDAHRAELVDALRRPVQTNEVGRSAALLVGYLEIARATQQPLRVVEIGSSAGLNLRWDRYRYEGGEAGSVWGDASSPLCFADCYVDPRPDLDVDAVVAERIGCDAQPIDASTDEGRLTLRSFVWADQLARFAALDAALRIAATMPVTIERRDARAFLDEQLARQVSGVTTVVVHSIVWQYLTRDTRGAIVERLRTAGAAATNDAPLAWLRMEPGKVPKESAELRLAQWPSGDDRLVARAGYHGAPIMLAR